MIGQGGEERKDRRRGNSCLGWGSFEGSPPPVQVQTEGDALSLGDFGRP